MAKMFWIGTGGKFTLTIFHVGGLAPNALKNEGGRLIEV
jgi:hypothetical protein